MLYRFTLEKYSGNKSRHTCPACNKPNKFTRYVNIQTGEYIHNTVGKCNREISCGYHLKPREYFKETGISKSERVDNFKAPKFRVPPKTTSYIPFEVLRSSIEVKDYERNHFVHFLTKRFGDEITRQLVERYFIGTSNHWKGSTVFWQIDETGKIRSGKILLYNPDTGKRVKEPVSYITWVHKVLIREDFNLKQCLFGEHLLKDKSRSVAIVESEKSAIIGSAYFPQLVWIAVGSLMNLKASLIAPLKGRKIILYPDLGAFDKWKAKAKEFSGFANFAVSDILERISTDEEKKQGLDIADFFLRLPLPEFLPAKERFKTSLLNEAKGKEFVDVDICFNTFQSEGLTPEDALAAVEELGREYGFEIEVDEISSKPIIEQTESQGDEIEELINFFNSIELPTYPVKLSECLIIRNVAQMIKGHTELIQANRGSKIVQPYLERLKDLKAILIK